MPLKKVTLVEKSSVWREQRSSIEGETFRVEGDRYYPESAKAKALAAAEGIEYFVFIGTVATEDVKEKKTKPAA